MDGYVQALVPGPGATSGGLFPVGLVDEADRDRIADVVAATREAGVAVVPTETLLENLAAARAPEGLLARPENAYLSASLLNRYRRSLDGSAGDLDAAAAARLIELRRTLIHRLHDGGVVLLLGSDAPQIFNVPGFSLQRELAAMTAAGLGPWEALRTGTRNPAAFFGKAGEFGTLEVGAAADLVWLAGNPLDDIAKTRSIRGVMARGRWFDRDELDRGLAAIRERHQR